MTYKRTAGLRSFFLSIVAMIAALMLDIQDARAQSGIEIDPSFSASWFNPDESGHGVLMHLLDENTAWMCWFAFDLDGNPAWICGIGTISGDRIEFPEAFTIEGGAFPPKFDPSLVVEVPWGTITIVFTGCDSGFMTWTTDAAGFQSGEMPLTRLTHLWGNECQVPPPPVADIVIPRSQTIPAINGDAAPGEWDDAVVVNIVINPQWTVPVSLKNDGSTLYALFSNVGGPNGENRVPAADENTTFPELFFDLTPADSAAIDNSVYWFHASFQDCFIVGRFGMPLGCRFILPLWEATNWPLGSTRNVTEIAITYERLDLEPGRSHLVGLFATMTSSLLGLPIYHNWPEGSAPDQPATWSLARLE